MGWRRRYAFAPRRCFDPEEKNTMTRNHHILFTATFTTPFIREDLRILQEKFSVTPIIAAGWTTFLKYFFAIFKSSLTFSWFASVYSSVLVLFATLLHKKSVIVLGGVDVANEKEIDYGIWNTPWKARFVRYGLRNATAVVAVDEFLKREAIRLAEYNGSNISVIYCGFDETKLKPLGEKQNFVLTVGACPDIVRIKKKGVDVLLKVAAQMTDVQFVVVGVAENVQRLLQPSPNITFYPFLPQEELLSYYQRAKVFCQPSLHEGMPNTLCEAMLCECVPVGSNRSGIPMAIGDTGFLCEYGNVEETVKAIHAALASPSDLGQRARQRIISEFHISKREASLQALISSLLR